MPNSKDKIQGITLRVIKSVIGATLVSTLFACGGGGASTENVVATAPGSGSPQGSPPSPSPAPQSPPTPAPPPSPAPTSSPAPAPAPSPAPAPAPSGGETVWKPEWATATSAKLRPGSLLKDAVCTAGFLFVDPVKQTYYLGTAAHCTKSANGTTRDGTGTRVTVLGIGEVGTVVLDSDGPAPNSDTIQSPDAASVDFTLIQLDPGINLKANPEVLSFQGPKGFLACTDLQAGNTVGFYGQATPFAEAGQQSRTGAVVRCNALANQAEVAVRSVGGDSGGPMLRLSDGKAIGFASAGTVAYMYVVTMDDVFRALTKAGFGNVALATIDGSYVKP